MTCPAVAQRAEEEGDDKSPSLHFFFLGIFVPAFLASDSAMAIACLRLLTSGPFLEPEWSSPCLYSRMTFSTLLLPLAFSIFLVIFLIVFFGKECFFPLEAGFVCFFFMSYLVLVVC